MKEQSLKLESEPSMAMTMAQNPRSDYFTPEKILVVDDEPLVRDLLSSYLTNSGYICETAGTGREALRKLRQAAISLVIADIRMPELNGLQLLESLTEEYPDTAAIMITAVADVNTAVGTMKQGAYDYITKPFNLDKVASSVESALVRRQTRLESRKTSQDLEQVAEKKAQALTSALRDLNSHREMTLDVLMKVLDARGHETQAHSQRVRAYTLRLARQMDFPDKHLIDLGRGALLHDIGKVGIPDSILLKPGRLNAEEWRQMKQHTVIGHRILKGVQFLDRVAEMVLSHHERFDGKGYPRGLSGDEIILEARMFSILDAWDAMTSNRPYRDAQSVDFARGEISNSAGSQFDPAAVEAFMQVPVEEWLKIGVTYREQLDFSDHP